MRRKKRTKEKEVKFMGRKRGVKEGKKVWSIL